MKEIWLALIPATIPTLTVLVGILLNQTGLSKLEGRLTARIDHLEARIDRIEATVNARIDRIEATMNSRMDGLSKQINEAVVMLMGRDTEKAERLAKLEERTSKSKITHFDAHSLSGSRCHGTGPEPSEKSWTPSLI